MSTEPSKALTRAAQRATSNEFFLANVFSVYQRTRNINDEALAEQLQCEINDLSRLALCRRPLSEGGTFLGDVQHLAKRFRLSAHQLTFIIRQVDALNEMRHHLQATGNTQGLLQAARDREDGLPESKDASDD